MAAMISHLTPPLDKATLHPGLRELRQIISDIRQAKEGSPQVAEGLRADLTKKVAAQGIGKDLGVEKFDDDEALEKLEDYLEEIGNKFTPLGLHTFGVAPDKKAELATAEAMLSLDANLTPECTRKDGRHRRLARSFRKVRTRRAVCRFRRPLCPRRSRQRSGPQPRFASNWAKPLWVRSLAPTDHRHLGLWAASSPRTSLPTSKSARANGRRSWPSTSGASKPIAMKA